MDELDELDRKNSINYRESSESTINTISEYKKIINTYPVLDNDYHIKLLTIYNNASEANKQKTKETLILHNISLVWKVASKYFNSYNDFEDLMQSGILGLICAIEAYDLQSGVYFSTFAYTCINNSISENLSKTSNFIRVPRMVINTNNKIKKYINSFVLEQDCEPSISNIIENTLFSEKQVKDYYNSQKQVISLDSTCFKDVDGILLDVIESEISSIKNTIIDSENIEYILKALLSSKISDRAKEILILYFGFNSNESYSLVSIARMLNVSKQNIHSIFHRSLVSLSKDEKFLKSLKAIDVDTFVKSRVNKEK